MSGLTYTSILTARASPTKYGNDDIAGKIAKYDEKRQNHEPFK
jgi:hypothetical protein